MSLAHAAAAMLLAACATPADAPAPAPARAPAPAAARTPGAPPPGRAPAPGAPPGGSASGAALQDPTGFPVFHSWPAPPGPAPQAAGAWSAPVQLSEAPGGGYRPQIVASPDGTLHAVFYARLPAGDLIRHRTSADGAAWSAPAHAGFDDQRNWGPDLVARDDGTVVMVFDHAQADFSSRGWLTTWDGAAWSAPTPLTPDDPQGEIGSGHVAHGAGESLAYVWIGKKMDPAHRFVARWRWFDGQRWSEPVAFTDGGADAWHANVERRPDGSMLAGWDVGTGGLETTLFVADGRDGAFAAPESLSAPPGQPGERPHFAFGADGTDHVAWFHKVGGKPLHVYVRSGRPGAWSDAVAAPADGLGGFHFDPDLAIDPAGNRVLVWGWDAGDDAELLYSVDRGDGFSPPAKVAEVDWGKPGLPSVTVAPDGRFHVVWNQGVRGDNHVYAATLRLGP